MKKRISILAVMLLVIISVVTLAACNPYKWESGLTGGDANSPVVSNGGYFVKQGNFAYFINGKGADVANNEFGTPFKQSIMRAPIKNNVVDSSQAKVVVPQVIYNEHVNGGFAIFNDFIYYVTPNNELGADKKPNTTMSNLMRTKIDGSVTQRIATFNTRNVNLLYTPTRVLYLEGTDIKFFDFSGMKTNKNIDDGKGVVSGVLASNVGELMWNMNSEYVFYTETIQGDDSYRKYNNLVAIKPDGSGKKTLITQNTYIDDKDFENNIANYYDQIFTIKLINMFVEADGSVALYYSKTTIGENSQTVGFFVNKVAKDGSFNAKTEKKLSTVVPTATIYPLGFEKGCIAPVENGFVWYEGKTVADKTLDGVNQDLAVLVPSGHKILNVINDYIYFTPTDTSAVYKVKLTQTPDENIQAVIKEKISEWFVMDWDLVVENGVVTNAYMYFFAADDYTYLHVADILNFNPDFEPFIDSDEEGNKAGEYDEGEKFSDINGDGKWTRKDDSTLVGKRTEADQKAWDEAHNKDKE